MYMVLASEWNSGYYCSTSLSAAHVRWKNSVALVLISWKRCSWSTTESYSTSSSCLPHASSALLYTVVVSFQFIIQISWWHVDVYNLFDVLTLTNSMLSHFSLLLWNVNFQPPFFALHSICGPNFMYILQCSAIISCNSIHLSCDVLEIGVCYVGVPAKVYWIEFKWFPEGASSAVEYLLNNWSLFKCVFHLVCLGAGFNIHMWTASNTISESYAFFAFYHHYCH